MRYSRALFTDSAILIVLIFAANTLAMRLSWYFYYWWFDMPMHFLGGAWVAYTALVLFSSSKTAGTGSAHSLSERLLLALVATLAIGLLWEVFEFGVGEAVRLSNNPIIDSVSDIFFDASGGIAGAAYFIFRHKGREDARPRGAGSAIY